MALTVIKKKIISLLIAAIVLLAFQAVTLKLHYLIEDSPSPEKKWFPPTSSRLVLSSMSTTMSEDDRLIGVYNNAAILDKQVDRDTSHTDSESLPGNYRDVKSFEENGDFARTDSESPEQKQVAYRDVKSLDKQGNGDFTSTDSETPESKPVTYREVESLDNKKSAIIVNENATKEPMVLALKYSEQISHALGNLLDLQCWARSVNITKVVEPSVKAFAYKVFHFLPEDKNTLQLRDLLDVDHWNKMSLRHGYSPLVSLEHFLQHATREMVYVNIVYRDENRSCNSLDTRRVAKKKWFQVRGFRITKVVCIDFTQKVTTERLFRDKIFQHSDRGLSVVFNTWRGIHREESRFRIPLTNSHCTYCLRMANVGLSVSNVSKIIYSHHDSKPPIIHSRRILKYADQFISKFLSGEKYVVVMLRTEMTKSSIIKTPPKNNSCVREILSDWKKMVKAKNLSKTLLFSDTGGHGSITLDSSPAIHFSRYIQNALHLELSENRVSSYFENITSSDDSVQIAVLEQELAVHATCVIVLGEGLFQQQTLNMYAHHHRGQECYVVRDPQCRQRYIRRVYDAFH